MTEILKTIKSQLSDVTHYESCIESTCYLLPCHMIWDHKRHASLTKSTVTKPWHIAQRKMTCWNLLLTASEKKLSQRMVASAFCTWLPWTTTTTGSDTLCQKRCTVSTSCLLCIQVLFIHSFILSVICSCVHSSIHPSYLPAIYYSFIHAFRQSFIYSFIHWSIHVSIHPFFLFIRRVAHSINHSLIQSLTHSLTQSLSCLFIH